MSERFAGQVVVVTGAAAGIGAAIASRMATEGAQVALLDRDADRLAETARTLAPGSGGNGEAYPVDVTDAAAVDATMTAIAERHGRIDVLVNNAGLTRDNLLFRMTDDDWDSVLDVNLKSVFLCARAVQRVMVPAGHGRIVSLSSRSALGNRGQANYAAAKAGIQGLTATLAAELGRYGITANAVAPGYVATAMTDATARRLGMEPEDHRAKAAESIPLGRVAFPEDIAAVVAFLASDDARFVTGQTLYVTGGQR